MNRAQAYQKFWSSFGWKAYDAHSVPSAEQNPEMPRITYEFSATDFDEELTLSASLWDLSHSWETVQKKAEEIYRRIGLGGLFIKYDEGRIWIKRGNPFYQRMSDENDAVRRIYLNVQVEFITSV